MDGGTLFFVVYIDKKTGEPLQIYSPPPPPAIGLQAPQHGAGGARDEGGPGIRPPEGPLPRPGSGPRRMVLIAIDPGHGGEDPGAIGPGGTREKDIVLQIALKLRQRINASMAGRYPMRAFLTRDADFS